MKHIGFFYAFMWLFCFLFCSSCRHEKPLGYLDTDADSLYISTPYVFTKPFRFPTIIHPYKDSVTEEGIELGRRLFYDINISATKNISCASCHKQQYAFADSGVVLGPSLMNYNQRNTPPLQNLLWSQKLFWNGRAGNVREAISLSLVHHLNWNFSDAHTHLNSDSIYVALYKKAFGRPGDITEEKTIDALQQFLLSLISSESRFDRIQRAQESFTPSEAAGFQIFLTESADCYHCHSDGVSLLMTDNLYRNIGLDSVDNINDFSDKGRGEVSGNPNEYGKFKTASLRNVTVTAPYIHDGRFKSLTDVIEHYSSGQQPSPNIDNILLKPNHANGGLHLSATQKNNIVEFLKTLTDTVFLKNPKHSNPF